MTEAKSDLEDYNRIVASKDAKIAQYLNEIKLKDDQIFEAKDKAETYRSNVVEVQRKEDKLKTELKQAKDELNNYHQQTSRGVSERNDLTMELSTLRTKVVNLNSQLDSYKT